MKRLIIWLTIVFAFILLIICSYSLLASEYVNVEIPLLRINEFGSSFFDKPSPGNWVKEEQIQIYDNRVVILIPNAIISSYANTNSMDSVIDENANGIEIVPQSPDQLQVGDIIAFKPNLDRNELIVHRIIKIGNDESGWYCITKGDNVSNDDGIKIRFDMIKYVTIGVLW